MENIVSPFTEISVANPNISVTKLTAFSSTHGKFYKGNADETRSWKPGLYEETMSYTCSLSISTAFSDEFAKQINEIMDDDVIISIWKLISKRMSDIGKLLTHIRSI